MGIVLEDKIDGDLKNEKSINKVMAAIESMGQTSLKNHNSNMPLKKINKIIKRARLNKNA